MTSYDWYAVKQNKNKKQIYIYIYTQLYRKKERWHENKNLTKYSFWFSPLVSFILWDIYIYICKKNEVNLTVWKCKNMKNHKIFRRWFYEKENGKEGEKKKERKKKERRKKEKEKAFSFPILFFSFLFSKIFWQFLLLLSFNPLYLLEIRHI